MNLASNLKQPLTEIEQRLIDCVPKDFPVSLRAPIQDFLKMPSKKIRPLLAIFASQAVGGSQADALPAATAVELFHDFTLIHDDIMDQDELRRGFPTLHIKYDESTAILAGDALIGLAFRELMRSPADARDPAAEIFTEALVRVCEGQALDKEFESRNDVQLDEYLDMIAKKTAWLIQTSCALGAICGSGTPEQVQHLSDYGYNLGMGFQIQDDLLDFVADEVKLGKKVGSDFRMHKTTYVTLKYREMLDADPALQATYSRDLQQYSDFPAFQKALRELQIIEAGEQAATTYFDKALAALKQVTPQESGNPLYLITTFLQERQY
ncbi:MAG: polyprenyl synthetase family protein [Calditrichia bacterium]